MSPTSDTLRRRARLAAGLRNAVDVRLEAGAHADIDDAVVVGRGEIAREQEQRLVCEIGNSDRALFRERMVLA